ncbi:MAG: tRNA (adenosine(37)-N6)-threonylcarbamoyltransferase complex dimerization subunit type 1 TsaB [Clostridia bacterium]|nr:tRNA (adenosine(37)-N6)-threonylcarbamoyltransferase complex dimerization subunit type 1 TsaB [Clostridia bacterium]
MNYLAVDTSGKYLTVIAKGKKKSVVFVEDCALSHSVILLDEIEKALIEADITLKEVDVFACAVGPGSFTGIRIGVATVKAFAYSLRKKVLSVTSFDTLAYDRVNGKRKLALISAGHNNYYGRLYAEDGCEKGEPFFASQDEIMKTDGFDEVVCDGQTPFDNSYAANVVNGFENAVEANLFKAVDDLESLIPLYVKKSQAEEEAK